MWEEINNADELESFMKKIFFFHDSCIKELKYVSGAYVSERLGMYPVNDHRTLSIVIQRQFEENSTIEMEFSGLCALKLIPTDDEYTCEILNASMFYRDGYIYWFDDDAMDDTNIEQYSGTCICAKRLRWRSIENHLGKEEFYIADQKSL